MDLRTEKLELIKWIASVQDADVITDLNAVKRRRSREAHAQALTPMTIEELHARARESEDDIAAGRVYSSAEVLANLGC